MENQIDNHVFGEGDFIDGNDYPAGSEIKFKVLDFVGRKSYIAKDSTPKRAAYFKVSIGGLEKEWRCGISNEKIMKRQFGFKAYEDARGKTFTALVKRYNLGNGIVLQAIETEPKPKVPPYTITKERPL